MANTNPSGGKTVKSPLSAIAMDNRDVAFAIGVAAILAILLLPLPTFILDLALTLSFSVSVLILMVALWIPQGSHFSSFPTVLLVVTMLRLALSVATTRAVLTHGHEGPHAAGAVIHGFSTFIMSGNYVIGFVIFVILLLVNFIVITKGSGRIAEVSARFTLDAIPGKQMAIDADLASGAITEKEANKRRRDLEEESGFYGAMDGASKFVHGDAIATLIITCINLIGGMAIGVAQRGLSASEAAATFSVLTVGDGLVATFPALLVSLSAGLVISKGSTRGSAEKAVFAQLGGYPKALFVAAGFLALIGIAPGLPLIPFWSLAATFTFIGWAVPRYQNNVEIEEGMTQAREEKPKTAEETVQDVLQLEEISLELGMALVPLASPSGGSLPHKLRTLRDRFASEFGFVLPTIQIKDSMELNNYEYKLLIHGLEVAKGAVYPNMKMMMAPNGSTMPPLPGEETTDPVFGIDAKWIDASLADEADALGCTVASADGVLITHVSEAVKENMEQLLTYSAAERLINNLSAEYAKLMRDSVPSIVSMITIQRILQDLLSERVSIRNLPTILEAIVESASFTRNIPMMVEHVRQKIGGVICAPLLDENRTLNIITLVIDWEKELAESIQVDANGERTFNLSLKRSKAFLEAAKEKIVANSGVHPMPPIVVNEIARPFVKALISRISPATMILSHSEIPSRMRTRAIDVISYVD